MATIVPYDVIRSRTQIEDGFALPAEWVDAFSLAVSTAETYTVPAAARFLRFTSSGAFYYNAFATAAEPSDEVADGTASVRVPADTPYGLYVGDDLPDGGGLSNHTAITTISLITEVAGGAIITIEVFS